MKSHEDMVQHLEQELDQHKLHPPDKHAKGLTVQNYKEKNTYLQSEVSWEKSNVNVWYEILFFSCARITILVRITALPRASYIYHSRT